MGIRKSAKKIIKLAKQHPDYYTKEEVLYAKLIKKITPKKEKNRKLIMLIFLDTADIEEIRKRDASGLIDGVTTNPTLIRKSGGDPVEVVRQISEEFPHFVSISAEVVADTAPEMIEQDSGI